MSAKERIKRKLPSAHCVKLRDGSGYMVWPSKGPGARGTLFCAIGFGTTARAAWASVKRSRKS